MGEREFHKYAAALLKLLAEKRSSLRHQAAFPSVSEPGFLSVLLGEESPRTGNNLETAFGKLEKDILTRLRVECHPLNFGFYPVAPTHEGVLADMVQGILPALGGTRECNHVNHDLDLLMCDWYAKAIDLPRSYHYSAKLGGCGTLINSVTEGCLLAINAARQRKLESCSGQLTEASQYLAMSKMVAYCSNQTHCGVEKMFRVAGVRYRIVDTLEDDAVNCEQLRVTMERDINNGLEPVICVATVGTTGCAAIDDLKTVGEICSDHGVWLHVDAAYAGNLCICPEFRFCWKGIEFADSVAVSLYKGFVNSYSAAIWLKDWRAVEKALKIEAEYIKYEHQTSKPTAHNMQIPTSKGLWGMKIWFVLYSQGVEGVQATWRKRASLATLFKELVDSDPRFEIAKKPQLNCICFRLKGENSGTEILFKRIRADGRVNLLANRSGDLYYLRCVSGSSEMSDVYTGWNIISSLAE